MPTDSLSIDSLPPLFFEIFDRLERQGPGDAESTGRAFLLATSGTAAERRRILDLGCGAGGQTLTLAELDTEASILAIDAHPPFIDTLQELARERGLSDRVRARTGDMGNLDLPAACADLIWSEGAAYVVGIGRALRIWRPLLSARGRIAFSELCWLTESRPEECTAYWMSEYPAIRTIDQNLSTIAEAGYRSVGHFVLPDVAWWKQYYDQVEPNVARLREERLGKPEDLELIEHVQAEIDQRRRFPEYYGYVFFIVEPTDTP